MYCVCTHTATFTRGMFKDGGVKSLLVLVVHVIIITKRSAG